MVKPIPEGYNTVSAYLVVPNAVEALAFYEKAFGAVPGARMEGPGGSTVHAEMRIGDSHVMLTDENPAWELKSPATLGGSAASLHLYVEDADAAFERAEKAGCTVVAPLMDAFWGDRYGKLQDPYGHQWGVATHKEDLSEAEIEKRGREFMEQMQQGGC